MTPMTKCGLNDKARNENTGKEHYYAHCRCAEKVRTGCDGFFNARRAATCTSKSMPADSRACAGDSSVGCDQRICAFDKFNVRLEQLPRTECGVTTTSGAVNFSTTARKRNQVDKGTLRIAFSDTPARSSINNPNPPLPWRSMSAALNACSSVFMPCPLHRIRP